MGELRTADLFLSAYLLTNGIFIQDIQVEKRMKPKVLFVFEKAKSLENLKVKYKQGAQTNILKFKKNYHYVQDLLHLTKRKLKI
ncbi:DUF5659 domain-containing protein [Candidatus Margulisiibacteriota bacterium]